MTDRLSVVSGSDLIRALERAGWIVARQKGSHVRLHHPERQLFLVVPLHRELKKGTLAGIMRDVHITREELNEFFGR